MENYVPRERILVVKIIMFESYEKGILNIKKLSQQEEYRVVIFMDGKLIDFQTGDELMHINRDENDYIIPEIMINTMYIDQIYNHPNVSEKEYKYAQELYEYYKMKQKLIDEKKLIKFPQKRIY